jgi:hypothetical protein
LNQPLVEGVPPIKFTVSDEVKVKGKGHPVTGHESPQVELRYGYTLSLTSALYSYGDGWTMPRPGHFTLVKDPVPIV